LDAITPSIEPIVGVTYYPCIVTLNDGTLLDRVCLVPQASWIKLWGIYPGQDHGKSEVQLSDISSIADSPSRLPARFANELYAAGESGMGYAVFTVVFSGPIPGSGSRQAYVSGNAVDFIDYPEGKGPGDVVSVLPHVGRDSNCTNGPKYYWCLYSE
jgi:hypothetical protein